MLDAGLLRQLPQIERRFQTVRNRLLAIDVLPRGDGQSDGARAPVRGLRVEIDGVVGVGQRGTQIGGPGKAAALRRNSFELGGIAPHQQRARHDGFALAHPDPALLDDGLDGPPQVLVQPHAAGHAVHNDADAVGGHGFSADCGHAPAGSGGASAPARGSVPSSSCRQWATSPAGP